MKKRSSGGGANWMDTYGDMVTLLMCFFVLLFSMSTMDQQKIQELVQAFNPDAIPTDASYGGQGGKEGNPPTMSSADVEQALENLYAQLSSYAEAQQSTSTSTSTSSGISVTKGAGYVFISLNDAVFFRGDSAVLLPEGEVVLDEVAAMLAESADSIDEIRVLGHTAREVADTPNNPTVDRTLSSGRAASVLVYLQDKGFLDPARMICQGLGEWRPIATNTTPEGQRQNRRVELIVSGLNVENPEENSVAQYYTDRGTVPPPTEAIEPVAPATAPAQAEP